MIAKLTAVVLSVLSFAAAQSDANNVTDTSLSAAAQTFSSSDLPSETAANIQGTGTTETSWSSAYSPTNSINANAATTPHGVFQPLAPIIASSESSLNTPEPSTTPSFSFEPTTTSEQGSATAKFTFQPTTTEPSQKPNPNTAKFTYQPSTTATVPSPKNRKPVIGETASTLDVLPTETNTHGPDATSFGIDSPQTAKTQTRLDVPSPSKTKKFTYQPAKSTPHYTYHPTPANPPAKETHSVVVVPVPAPKTRQSKARIESSSTAIQVPTKALHQAHSTITGPPIVLTIGINTVSQAHDGNYMLGSLTLSPDQEITQGSGEATQIVKLEASSGATNLVVQNAKTSATHVLHGERPIPTTLHTVNTPAADEFVTVHGHKMTVTPAPSVPANVVTVNGHTITVSTGALQTASGHLVTYGGHTVSLGGATLAAAPTGLNKGPGMDDAGTVAAASTTARSAAVGIKSGMNVRKTVAAILAMAISAVVVI